MELYLPSLLIIALGIGVVFGIFPRLSPFLLSIFAITLLVLAAYHHYSLFKFQYSLQSWMETGKSVAPILLIGVVVLLSIGYLLFSFSSRGVMPSLPTEFRSASPETATNGLTRMFSRAMRGFSPGGLISKNPSLNITSREAARVAESRLARQV